MLEIAIRLYQEDRSYHIKLGTGIFHEVLNRELKRLKPSKITLITDSHIGEVYRDFLEKIRQETAWTPDKFQILSFPCGEQQKSISTILDLFADLSAFGMDRHSLIIAFGGGVTGDLAGFLASVYLRGIPFIQVPTSLLAMVDSSIGGKTGVDTPQGKNLMGTFYQPRAVIIDVDFLSTLPEEEFINGMAEVVKHAAIRDRKYFDFIVTHWNDIRKLNKELLLEMVERSCRIKAEVVENDEKESGLRQILNFGHTFGHALEKATDYGIPHGYAVALGMVAAGKVMIKRGIFSAEEGEELTALLHEIGLLRYQKELKKIEFDSIHEVFYSDKKNREGKIHIVMLNKIGKVHSEEAKYAFPVSEGEIKEVLIELSK